VDDSVGDLLLVVGSCSREGFDLECSIGAGLVLFGERTIVAKDTILPLCYFTLASGAMVSPSMTRISHQSCERSGSRWYSPAFAASETSSLRTRMRASSAMDNIRGVLSWPSFWSERKASRTVRTDAPEVALASNSRSNPRGFDNVHELLQLQLHRE